MEYSREALVDMGALRYAEVVVQMQMQMQMR